ncbi:MAG: hypothetical protein HYZ34_00020 [Ignavibacteriae bacterium]|nr:hypothetical protein [Ignavibacteriota bacterium]
MSYKSIFITILILLSVLTFRSDAQIPRTISYQGVLTDNLGTPKSDGTYSFTFRLYESETGGTAIWSETKNLEVKRGLFYTMLGSQTAFGSSVNFEKPYWLSIQLASESEMTQRMPLTSVGYSLNASKATIADTVLHAPPTVVTPGSIDSTKLASSSVTNSKIQDGAITQNKIHSSVTYPIADGSITSEKIQDYGIQSVDIFDSAITQSKIRDRNVTNAKIANGAVTEDKIGDNQVTKNKISDNAISENKIENGAITTSKIADAKITREKIAPDAITSDKIQNFSIKTEDVAPDFKPPRAANADSALYVNGIGASTNQEPNTLYPLNTNRGITLVSSPSVYQTLSTKQLQVLQQPDAFMSLISGGAGCLINLIPGIGSTASCLLSTGVEVVTENLITGGLFKGNTYGVEAESNEGTALYAHSTTGNGLWASSISGLAGKFEGKVNVLGQLQTTGFKLTTSPTNGYVLTSDASGVGTWQQAPSGGGSGTVTSITAGTGLSANPNNPITTSGTLSLSSSYQDGSVYDSRFINEGQGFSGDVTGAYNNLTVGKIQNGTVASTAPSDGQVLKWNNAQSRWEPGTAGGGGSYINNQNSSAQSSANFWIDGTGKAAAIHAGNLIASYTSPIAGISTTSSGVYGSSSASGTYGGVFGVSTANNGYGVIGEANTGTSAYGVWGKSTTGYGIYGQGGSTAVGIFGTSTSSSYSAIEGSSSNNSGVYGRTTSSSYGGVIGLNSSGPGIYGTTTSGQGVYGSNNNSNTTGYAGYFYGRVSVTGNLSKGGGSFKIDHPLDPENKYLYHSFVESPDMKNIYDGVVELDGNGEQWVELPKYFDALNKDFRYQLTCLGSYAQIFIAEEINNNHFKIAGGKNGMRVSWQITGVRKDAYANANRIISEVEKEAENKGKYLHPKEFGKSETSGIDWNKIKLPETATMKVEEK